MFCRSKSVALLKRLISFGTQSDNMMINTNLLLNMGASFKEVQRNEIIFMEGMQASFYYQVVSGRVRWVNVNDEGREFIQLMAEEGESFGELPMMDDEPYAATAIADEDSTLIRLHKSHFLQLLKENPEVHFSFSKLLSRRLRLKFLLIKEMAIRSPEHTIIALLHYFKENNKHTCPDCSRVNLTRQQIADMTGLRVETVIRAMRHLHSTGQLLIEKGKVYCSK
ncbi:CRP-like cAMP-binding protein [Pseudobacter ginsenosidimutans]|uniref:CRP-like cAMP-binding protein n=2 Tax=Pseudobacter ginsenosidimutans TaxID=661488 RepID=A0A4Q7MMI8_9BACT|nr:CRP-like cAMP-binding protein [Pseudobacter ginsenosidimutans]